MSVIETGLAASIDASQDKARLDEVAKNLIKHKIILAHILKDCVDEFAGYSVEFIMNHCLCGPVQVNHVSVDRDVLDADSRIIGSDTEDASHEEGTVYFDIVFDALVPHKNEIVTAIINIEIQASMSPGYPVITRAIYYLGRLISRQKGTVFLKSDYGRLRKVYSIWICPSTPIERKNTVNKYSLTESNVLGHFNENLEDYDKMTAIMICLGEEKQDAQGGTSQEDSDEGESKTLVRLLDTLLSTTKPVESRKKILEEEYGIPMTKEIEEGMKDMCNLGEAVEQRGYDRGYDRGYADCLNLGQVKAIIAFQRALNLTTQKAMDILEVRDEDREKYMEMIEKELAKELASRNDAS